VKSEQLGKPIRRLATPVRDLAIARGCADNRVQISLHVSRISTDLTNKSKAEALPQGLTLENLETQNYVLVSV